LKLILVLCTGLLAAPACAQTELNLGDVTSTLGAIAAPGTASYEAPSQAPLNVGQPTSVVGSNFIRNATPPSESYDQLIALTPSVQDIQPNGPVAQQNYGESIRGFQYSQFNTMFDGIVVPGTTSSFSPQTAVYFTDHDIGEVSVDRGPGTADTIGYATFGGTVSILSKDPDAVATFNPYATMGSFRSDLYGLDLETGAQPGLNGGAGFIDLSDTASGAALSGTSTARKNVFIKWVQPLGSRTVVTAVAIVNRSYGHTPYGAQASQIKAYGDGYALNGDPDSQDFRANNTDTYNTDFEYVRVLSKLTDALTLTDTAYTASYYHNGYQGADPNGTTPNLFGVINIDGKPENVADDVPGLAGHNDFRNEGNIFNLSQTTFFGSVDAGFWIDNTDNEAFKDTADLSLGNVPYSTSARVSPLTYDYNDSLRTEQPYVQANITPVQGLTLIAGFKYLDVTRGLDAIINKSTLKPAQDQETFTDLEPSGEIKYKINPDWSVYGQIAQGFLAPPLSVFATTDVTALNPETTVNYQAGTSYQGRGLSASFDGYYIPFQNYIASQKIAGATIYSNQGGAVFKGFEAEATKTLLYHTALYINGSLNDATYDNGAQVAQSPRRTGAAGLIYDADALAQAQDHLYASLLVKEIGPQYGQDTHKVDAYPIKSTSDTTASIAYTFAIAPKKLVTVSIDMDNLFNRQGIVGLAAVAGNGVTPLYWTEPGRSFFFSLSGKFR
jgi:iron complex outermembrane receptor protein